MTDTRKAVDTLLEQYQRYKQVLAHSEALGREVARCKARGETVDDCTYGAAQHELTELSDAMLFDSPLIWVMYKNEAYANEAHPIHTLHDFRIHCSKPGHICAKRFIFVNAWLGVQGKPSLSSAAAYPDDMPLVDIYDLLIELGHDRAAIKQWRLYEYYREDMRVAKWRNYSS